MRRRHLIATAAGGLAATPLAAPALAQDAVRWNMVMPWPRNTPGVGTGAERFAERVNAMSGGRLELRLFGAGELVPPFEGLDAVQSGTADIAHGTPYYWVGKAPALHYFTGLPFGFTAPELAAWIYHGDGMRLWREVYDRFNVVPFYAGSSGVQAGGWFRKEITSLEDLRGLKFRIAGLGGEVMKRLGVVTEMIPPGEIAPSLLSGRIDAAEWIGPWNDRAFGLYKVASFYYVPAFHEPGPGLEIIVNKDRWNELSPELQAIVEGAASATANETYADFVYPNSDAYGPLLAENDVQVRTWPDDIVRALGETTLEVLAELAETDELTGRIHESFMTFLRKADEYGMMFDHRMLEMRHMVLRS
ncbi:MAG TPA: TRAP transporter substrate-binding protein [Geminicoccaceae bacterium]|nr:TRAP transporter substrate-binding protein [Geminicoccaceae bacterium]